MCIIHKPLYIKDQRHEYRIRRGLNLYLMQTASFFNKQDKGIRRGTEIVWASVLWLSFILEN